MPAEANREGVTAMPIATEVRAYADAALKQGKTALSQASTAVNTATDRVVELVEDAPKACLRRPRRRRPGHRDRRQAPAQGRDRRLPVDRQGRLWHPHRSRRGQDRRAPQRPAPGQAQGRCQRRRRNPSGQGRPRCAQRAGQGRPGCAQRAGQGRPGHRHREVSQPTSQAGPPRCTGPQGSGQEGSRQEGSGC
jgi:hypothetical protein